MEGPSFLCSFTPPRAQQHLRLLWPRPRPLLSVVLALICNKAVVTCCSCCCWLLLLFLLLLLRTIISCTFPSGPHLVTIERRKNENKRRDGGKKKTRRGEKPNKMCRLDSFQLHRHHHHHQQQHAQCARHTSIKNREPQQNGSYYSLSLSLCIHILGYLWAYVRTHRTQCARFLYIFWVKYFVEVNRFFYRLTHRMSFFVLGKFFSLNKFIYILFPSVLSKFFFCFTPHTHVTISFRVA